MTALELATTLPAPAPIERGGGRPTKGGYRNAKGEEIPSVTTVLGATTPKPALVGWAYKRGQENLPLYASRDVAGEIGQSVHDAVEEFEYSGALPTFAELRNEAMGEEKIAPRESARLAFDKYRDWRAWSRFNILAMEVPLVSERLGFAGTPDTIAIRDGKLTLLDWKTSGGIYAEYLLQIAAYALLWEDLRGGHFEGFEILRLAKDGSDFEHRAWTRAELEEANVFSAWRRSLELYTFQSPIKALLKKAA